MKVSSLKVGLAVLAAATLLPTVAISASASSEPGAEAGSRASSPIGASVAQSQKRDDRCLSDSTDHLCLQRVSGAGVFLEEQDCISVMDEDAVSGDACFKPDVPNLGEVLYVRDDQRDGYEVGVWWYRADGARAGICINDTGRYDHAADPYPDCDLPNIPEGVRVYFRVGKCDAAVHACNRTGGTGWIWTTKGKTTQHFNYRNA